ncbi:voltage-gated chloride channel [Yamadazyma tenuis ATCC 10573]|uniref:Chloride channel protein n=1 Tax=Candida tenuis (strain ATCC 10573 / BCRC 21748 / CBS 615 / JCM 9827 / NBRC 10315 / NRRL Y-1498 / VKM Y-70) TaxID=590646 RepID=G3AYL2_CANTC|nr:voltage-gated chloride channel [Yamadazyma tenuis ATCC 10573]EGV65879.1 voltage-gated chloride channel [Yamadazyma tenuis ATCC 10573]
MEHESRGLRDPTTGQWLNQEQVAEVKRFDEFVTIDWVEDELLNHRDSLLKNRNARVLTSLGMRLLSFAQNWLVLGAMGMMIGLVAAYLSVVTAWLASARTGYCSSGLYLNKSFCCWGQDEHNCSSWNKWSRFEFINYLIFILLSLVFSLTAAVLVKFYSPAAAGSGISEIKSIVSGFAMKGFLGWWTLLIKSLGLPLAIASGLSVGKEGPSVHYAVCIGNSVAKTFTKYKKSASKSREFLTATAAAGVAVAFGSPMGGVLFAMEEISSVFHLSTIMKSYFCALIAVGTLAIMNPFRTGQLVIFEVSYDTSWHYFEIPVYIVLGLFGGFYGIFVSSLNIRVTSFRKRYLNNFAIREVFLLALLTAIICYFNEFLRLDMTESMEILFHECNSKFEHSICSPDSKRTNLVVSLLFATLMRMVFTIISYGCKVPAGIFVPSMAAGATFGRALGIIVDYLYQNNKKSNLFATCGDSKCVIPGSYAFLGAAAALCGITHLTVAVVVIMFELTGALRYIIPTMIVVSITKLINDKWGKGGIADQMIRFNGLPIIDPKEEFVFNTSVASAFSPVTVTIPIKSDTPMTLGIFKTILTKNSFRGLPLVESEFNPKIVGYVSTSDIKYVMENYPNADDKTICNFNSGTKNDSLVDFSSVINPCPLTISVSTSLEYVLDVFAKLGPRYMLVEDNGLLAGIITRKDVLRYEFTSRAANSNDTNQKKREEFEAKVWGIMMLLGSNLKKNIGKFFYNDANRFL